jgi:hypothetical protein
MSRILTLFCLMGLVCNISFTYPLEVTVKTNKPAYYQSDKSFQIIVTAKNITGSTLNMQFSSACQINFCIDSVCYNPGCALVLTSVTIPFGGTHTWTQGYYFADLGDTLPRGIHNLTAWIGEPDSSFGIFGSARTTFKIFPDQMDFTYYINKGWNYISLPLFVADARKEILFPTAISKAYTYERRYVIHDILQVGKGYWLKFNSAQYITISGKPVICDTVNVQRGWNMLGSVIESTDPWELISIPPNIIIPGTFYSWDDPHIYISIKPGRGIWLRTYSAGKIILQAK